jgi:uncharacterized repeat protein (TIGR04076 family)
MNCKITIIKISDYKELQQKYELPQENPCFMKEGDVFISENGEMPKGFCTVAWETLKPFVDKIIFTDERIYGDWMKDPHSAMVSCNDGFRPVSFYLERI